MDRWIDNPVPCPSEALVGAPPGALCGPHPLGLSEHVVPHHLIKVKYQTNS